MQGGYVGKLLRVNLSNGKITDQPLPPDDVLRKFIGGWGLGLKILYDELPLGIHPGDPRNLLIFMNGPLTGTGTISGNNATVVTLNFSTGYTAARSHSHGFWGPNLKFAGYDGIIIEGASDKPVYLWIHEGKTEIRDASAFWGQDTHDTEDSIRQAVGESGASVAAIGPAGENLCSMALIENDKNHTFAHSGVGAVMGSKKLKAIAVFGTGKPAIANESRFKEARQKWLELGRVAGEQIKGGVIPRTDYKMMASLDCGVITRNWQSTELPGYGEGMSRQKIRARSCFACPIACCYDIEIVEGPYKGYVATLGMGAEHLEALGPNLGITEVGAWFFLPDLADRLGFEGAALGSVLSLAFECYEKGIITKEDTDGLELKWGDAEVAEKLIRKIAAREGLGQILAEGPGKAADIFGGEAPQLAIHVKNSGINFHDWKSGPWGTMFGQYVGGGSGWMAFNIAPPYRTHKGKVESFIMESMGKYWIDSIGHCTYSMMDPNTFPLSVDAIAGATGWDDFTAQEALLVGERMMTLERAFNVRRGLRPEDDYNVSKRVVEAPKDGRSKGLSLEPYLKGMVLDYYTRLGWDEKTGKPLRSTLERLGLEEVIKDMWG